MFSKACEYAIRAALYISVKSIDGSKLGIKEIAKEIDSPEHFTAKILQTLSREGVISSIKGPNGGFFLDPKSKPIPLNAIVKAIDGDDILNSCSLGLKQCSDKFPCPIHNEIKVYKEKIRDIMKEKTLQHLSIELAAGKTFLRNYKIRL
ncbi:MAG TPA: Rrf2 family transcriptional regulator [Chryseolinea sp.]|jgi:Rrf2 family protein|nr:Rrf2 family transcriptional regulator [Chryseolinea sp.]